MRMEVVERNYFNGGCISESQDNPVKSVLLFLNIILSDPCSYLHSSVGI